MKGILKQAVRYNETGQTRSKCIMKIMKETANSEKSYFDIRRNVF